MCIRDRENLRGFLTSGAVESKEPPGPGYDGFCTLAVRHTYFEVFGAAEVAARALEARSVAFRAIILHPVEELSSVERRLLHLAGPGTPVLTFVPAYERAPAWMRAASSMHIIVVGSSAEERGRAACAARRLLGVV